MKDVNKEVEFELGSVNIGNERYEKWKMAWIKLRKDLKDGERRNKRESFKNKNMQSEIV